MLFVTIGNIRFLENTFTIICNLQADFILFWAVLCNFVVLESFASRVTVPSMWRASAGHNVTASVGNVDDDDWDTDPDFVVSVTTLEISSLSQLICTVNNARCPCSVSLRSQL